MKYIEKIDLDNKKSLKKQVNMIIYWKLCCNNEYVAQEGFQGSEGRFFYGT